SRATTLLEREFTFPAERFSLSARNGETLIEYRGASREFTAGRPDLPWMGELVEVPAGLKLVRVEVLDLQSAPLAASARIPRAVGRSPSRRSTRARASPGRSRPPKCPRCSGARWST